MLREFSFIGIIKVEEILPDFIRLAQARRTKSKVCHLATISSSFELPRAPCSHQFFVLYHQQYPSLLPPRSRLGGHFFIYIIV